MVSTTEQLLGKRLKLSSTLQLAPVLVESKFKKTEPEESMRESF